MKLKKEFHTYIFQIFEKQGISGFSFIFPITAIVSNGKKITLGKTALQSVNVRRPIIISSPASQLTESLA